MSTKKYGALIKSYEELSLKLERVDHQIAKDLLASWGQSLSELEEWLKSGQVTKSQVTPGLEQGFRELPEIFSNLPDSHRGMLLQEYKKVVSNNGLG